MLFESLSILCVYNNSRISFYTLILAFRFLHRSHFVLPIIRIIRNLILVVFRKISRHRRVICKVPPISVARISSWGILCRNLCCHRPESVIAAFICHAIIYSLSLVCPIYLIPKLSEDMVTKDGAVVKLIRCNVLFLWV